MERFAGVFGDNNLHPAQGLRSRDGGKLEDFYFYNSRASNFVLINYRCHNPNSQLSFPNPYHEFLECFGGCGAWTGYSKQNPLSGVTHYLRWTKAAQLVALGRNEPNKLEDLLGDAKQDVDGILVDEVAPIGNGGMLIKNCADSTGRSPNFGWGEFESHELFADSSGAVFNKRFIGISTDDFIEYAIKPCLRVNMPISVVYADFSGHTDSSEREMQGARLYSVPNMVIGENEVHPYVYENLNKIYTSDPLQRRVGIAPSIFNPHSVGSVATMLRNVQGRGDYDYNTRCLLVGAMREEYPFLMQQFVDHSAQGKWETTPAGFLFWTWGSSTEPVREKARQAVYYM